MEDELLRRIRAARAYAGLSQPELAQRLGMSQDTLKRIELGRRDFRDYEQEGFLRAVAEATTLPAEFFTVDDLGAAVKFAAGMDEADAEVRAGGYNPPADPALERLERIEATLEEFRRTWGELAAPAIGLIEAAARERLDELEESEASREATQPGAHRHPQRRAV